MKPKLLALLFVLLAVVAVAACGGDDDSDSSATPSASGSATEGPHTTPPPLEDPHLGEGVTEVKHGDLGTIEVPVGGVYYIDPKTLGENVTLPACEKFQFAFAWQVTEPYPPAADAIEWQSQGTSGNTTISDAPSGEQSVACDPIQAVNKGEEKLTIAVKYAIGAKP